MRLCNHEGRITIMNLDYVHSGLTSLEIMQPRSVYSQSAFSTFLLKLGYVLQWSYMFV